MGMEWVGKILPTIGTLLGGPLGGAAVEAAANALGLSDKTKGAVEKALASGELSAEQIAALQAADLQLKTKMAELGIEAERIAQADRESARKMQIDTHSIVPALLTLTLTIGYFAILIGLMTGDLKLWDNPAMTLLLGALTTAWGSSVAYYFGSSPQRPEEQKK